MSGETKKTVICLVGLASLCAMFRSPFVGLLISGIIPDSSILHLVYDTTTILLGCVLAVVSLWRRKNQRGDTHAGKALISSATIGLLTIVGIFAITLGKSLGLATDGFYITCTAVLCIGFASLIAGWFRVLLAFSRNKVTVLVVGAFVLSHVFGVLDLVPREWLPMLRALYPLLASVMLFLLRGEPLALSNEKSNLMGSPYIRKVQICAMALVFAELLCGAFLRSRWALGGPSFVPHLQDIYAYAITVAIGVLFWYIAKRVQSTATSTLVIGGIGLVGFIAATFLAAFVPFFILAPFMSGLYSSLLAYAMALIGLWGIDNRHSFLSCAGMFLVLFGLTSGISFSIVPTMLATFQIAPGDFLLPASIMAGFVISIGMCVALLVMTVGQKGHFQEEDVREVGGEMAGHKPAPDLRLELSSDERHEYVMDMIAARYDLTERGRETASLMARGYTAKHVAEELTVAVSTVKGYSKSIYRKMGIHRKDELIEIVKETKEQV